MILKNLTSKRQNVKFRIVEDKEIHNLTITPHGIARLDRAMIIDEESLVGIVEIDGVKKSTVSEITVEEVIEDKVEEFLIEEEDETLEVEEEEESEEPIVAEDKFICDECGAEFASDRGLASHISRVHK